MKKPEEFIENRILWRASKNGLPNKTALLFDSLEVEDQKRYLSLLKGLDVGKILFLFKHSQGDWTVLSVKMIAGSNNGELNYIKLDSIAELTSADMKQMKTEFFLKNPIPKQRFHKLSVTDFKSKERIFITEEGSDLFALWNILLMITRINYSE